MDEPDEKLQSLNDNVLILEKEGKSQVVLKEIFRAAHTVKGSSAMLGYEKISSLTHEIENLFEELRQDRLEVSRSLIDVVFMALDKLKFLRDEIVRIQSEGNIGIEEELKRLKAFHDENKLIGASDEETLKLDISSSKKVHEAELSGLQTYQISLDIDPDCQMKSARAFLVFETLKQTGEIIKSIPPVDEILDGKFDKGLSFVLVSDEDIGNIRNLLFSIAEVNNVEVVVLLKKELQSEELENNTQAKEKSDSEKKLGQTVRVDVHKLDALMNLVGELVIDRTRLNKIAEVFEDRIGSSELIRTLSEVSDHVGQVTNDLQEQVMKARMLPVAQVFNRFPRMVRDLARKLNKEVNFVVSGEETEVDRNVIEVIGDPLIHLIRNAVDHGIESPEERVRLGKQRYGTILLGASYQENNIIITLEDDGRGIDTGKLKKKALEKGLFEVETINRMSEKEMLGLIFLPGFTTTEEISDLSGRGVGLDVVYKQIEQANGMVEVLTNIQQGTKFTIRLPLTLAIIKGLMVSLGGQVYAFPLTNVLETMRVKSSDVKKIGTGEVIVIREQVLPLLRLGYLFDIEMTDSKWLFVVVVGVGTKRVGVVVDYLLGEQEIVIKSLGDYLGQVRSISGATILGDGQVCLIIDTRSLVKEVNIEETLHAVS